MKSFRDITQSNESVEVGEIVVFNGQLCKVVGADGELRLLNIVERIGLWIAGAIDFSQVKG